jgi:predicted phosphoribosyltransferase
MQRPFLNRREAGQILAAKLTDYAHRPDVIAQALSRGGVPVGYEVANSLDAPFDIFLVRKLGVPGFEELAGVRVLNDRLIQQLGIPKYVIDAIIAKEEEELKRRERLYRGVRPPLTVRGRTVILVDDGLATGATMEAPSGVIYGGMGGG